MLKDCIKLINRIKKRIKNNEKELKKGKVSLSWKEFKNLINLKHLNEAHKKGIITVPWKEIHDILKLENKPLENTTVKLHWRELKKMLAWSIKKKVKKISFLQSE